MTDRSRRGLLTPMIIGGVLPQEGLGRFENSHARKQIYRFFLLLPLLLLAPFDGGYDSLCRRNDCIIHQPGVCDGKKITRSRTRDMTDTYAERGRTSHAVRSNSKPELALPQLRMVGWGLWIQRANFLNKTEQGLLWGNSISITY